MSRTARETVLGVPVWPRARDGIWRADLRRFAHVGGGREAFGTRDRTEFEKRLAARVSELESKAEDARLGRAGDRLLSEFSREHLKAKRNEVRSEKTLANDDRALRYLLDHMGKKARVSDVRVAALEQYRDERLRKVSAATVNHELSSISSMLDRAVRQGIVARNEAAHTHQANEPRIERVWLEVEEGVRLLAAARALEESGASRAYPHLHALVATFLLTGGRCTEVLGLTTEDVDLERRADGRGRIHVRPNDWRGLGSGIKNETSIRSVPLWSQLRRILAEHLERIDQPGLLFPSHIGGGMLQSVYDSLGAAAEKAKIKKLVTPHVLRHTYTAVRLQTVDAGEPVALYTVARELGHSGTKQIERTYGHVLEARIRLSEVRFEPADVIDLASRRQA